MTDTRTQSLRQSTYPGNTKFEVNNYKVKIVELKKGELVLVKELRLRALKDAPRAFAESFREAAQKDDAYWQHMVDALTPPNPQRMFIAQESEWKIGSVFALLDSNDRKCGRLGGMWVHSNYRRRGAGHALVRAVQDWAVRLDLQQIKLWVEDSAGGPKSFYTKLGFAETGLRDTSRSKIDKVLTEMQWVYRRGSTR